MTLRTAGISGFIAHRACSAHHLVFVQPTIEWRIWIDTGEQPLPRQLALSYVREPGEPQYVAVLTKWKLSPTLPSSQEGEAPARAGLLSADGEV